MKPLLRRTLVLTYRYSAFSDLNLFLTTETLGSHRNTEAIPVYLSVTMSPWFNFNF
jgi:hypothetical protein